MLRTLSHAVRGRGTAIAARTAARAIAATLPARGAAAAFTHSSAAAAAPITPAAAPSTAALYRSPLRSVDDRSFAHLWDDAWTLDAARPRASVIWLHGLAQRKEDVRGLADIMAPPHTRFCVPQSPKLSISCMPEAPDQRAWFDLIEEARDAAAERAAGEAAPEDEVGIDEMTQRVHDLIAHEMQITGLPSHCILLAGFGEGGALALHAGLCYPKPLAGVLSVAGYLALPQRYPQHIHDAQRSTRVLAVHGASDTIVPLPFAKHRYAALHHPSGPNLPFDLRTEWSMGHFVTNTAMMATQGWITDAFKKAEQAAQQQQQKASA